MTDLEFYAFWGACLGFMLLFSAFIGVLEIIQKKKDLQAEKEANERRRNYEAKQWEDTAKDLFISKEKQQVEIERLNNLKRFEKFICERIHTDKERNLTWDFATKEAEQEAFEQELEKLFDISTARAEAIKEFAERLKDLSCGSDLYDRGERWVQAVTVEEIDETYNEMVGEDK